MFKVNREFEKLALSHYGYDGGNLKAPLWVSGIEWGGGVKISELVSDISKGPILTPHSVESISDRNKYLNYVFDRIWLKVLSKSLGYEVSDYKKMINDDIRALSSSGPVMKFNLYPISFKDTSFENWSRDFYEVTGFPTKELYMAWVQSHRFKFFNELVSQYKPDVILCSGVTFLRDFLLAFGGVESLFSTPVDKVKLSDKKELYVYQSAISSNTKIYVVPFFGSIHGTKKDSECDLIGELLQKKLVSRNAA